MNNWHDSKTSFFEILLQGGLGFNDNSFCFLIIYHVSDVMPGYFSWITSNLHKDLTNELRGLCIAYVHLKYLVFLGGPK